MEAIVAVGNLRGERGCYANALYRAERADGLPHAEIVSAFYAGDALACLTTAFADGRTAHAVGDGSARY